MKLLLDTNRYRDFCAADPLTQEILQQAEQVFIPFIVLAELKAGFLSGQLARQNESALTRFLNRPRVRVLFPDLETTNHYAQIYAQLRHQGTPIPTNDLWIAALAIQHGLLLFSRDHHFSHLPQIARIGSE
jgi:tRNA(fMet)-specific endonuclease VapC